MKNFGGLFMAFALGVVLTTWMAATLDSQLSVPRSDRLNEPCHYGAKPMMVEDGNMAGKHRVVCGCPQ